MKNTKSNIRLPKGASLIRFDGDPNTHLLYCGIRWGYVFKPTQKLKHPYKWYSNSVTGGSNWGRTKDDTLRLLTRTLRDELKRVQELVAPKGGSYRKLSHRDILRWKDEYRNPSGKWLPVYGPATGSHHTVGMHPTPGTEYRRPIKGVENLLP